MQTNTRPDRIRGIALARSAGGFGRNIITHLGVTVIMPALFWGRGEPPALILWIGGMLGLALWRYRLLEFGRLPRIPLRLMPRVARELLLAAAAVGILHGLFVTWLIPHATWLERQFMLIAPCVGLASIALATRTWPRAAASYAGAAGAVIALWVVLHPESSFQLAGFFAALFMLSILRMLATWREEELDRIESQASNRALTKDLVRQREEADRALALLHDEIEQRKRIEHQVEISEQRFARLMDAVAIPVFVFRDKFIYVNDAAADILGFARGEIVGQPIWSFFHPEDADGIRRNAEDRMHGYSAERNYEARIVRKDGDVRWLNINSGLTEYGGEPAGMGIAVDITDRKVAELALEAEREKAQLTLASIGDGVVTLDAAGNIELLNETARRMFNLEAHDHPVHLQELGTFIDEDSGLAWDPCAPDSEYRGVRHNRSLILKRLDGSELPVEVTVTPVSERAGGVVLALRDVREIRSLLEVMRYQATHDPLTELINRREFERRLGNVVENARTDHSIHGLLFMDLDKFKIVNDSCGHMAGDALLRAITARLSDMVRDVDTIARLGGDEFGILLANCPRAKCERIAEDMRESIVNFTFSWKGRTFRVGASIGLVMVDRFTESAQDALIAADNACYVAKEHGRNRVHTFTRSDRAVFNKISESDWVNRLQAALKNGSLELAVQQALPMQPSVNTEYHELLLRLGDREGDAIPAARFLTAADRHGVTVELDRWVLRSALEFIARLPASGEGTERIVAINLSSLSLSNPDFRAFAKAEVASLASDRGTLCFEITETSVISNLDHAQQFIREMHERGCRIAIDDFGAGMNSFRSLKILPVDIMKVDRSFVGGVTQNERDAALLRSMLEVGHVLGLVTIAEGVEDGETLAMIRDSGATYAQGYALERPLPIADSSLGVRARQSDARSVPAGNLPHSIR